MRTTCRVHGLTTAARCGLHAERIFIDARQPLARVWHLSERRLTSIRRVIAQVTSRSGGTAIGMVRRTLSSADEYVAMIEALPGAIAVTAPEHRTSRRSYSTTNRSPSKIWSQQLPYRHRRYPTA